jgi:hypothetical protein
MSQDRFFKGICIAIVFVLGVLSGTIFVGLGRITMDMAERNLSSPQHIGIDYGTMCRGDLCQNYWKDTFKYGSSPHWQPIDTERFSNNLAECISPDGMNNHWIEWGHTCHSDPTLRDTHDLHQSWALDCPSSDPHAICMVSPEMPK